MAGEGGAGWGRPGAVASEGPKGRRVLFSDSGICVLCLPHLMNTAVPRSRPSGSGCAVPCPPLRGKAGAVPRPPPSGTASQPPGPQEELTGQRRAGSPHPAGRGGPAQGPSRLCPCWRGPRWCQALCGPAGRTLNPRGTAGTARGEAAPVLLLCRSSSHRSRAGTASAQTCLLPRHFLLKVSLRTENSVR